MASDRLIGQCDVFLKAKHATLWGRAFNVIHPAGRAEAARWLAREFEELQTFIANDRVAVEGNGSLPIAKESH